MAASVELIKSQGVKISSPVPEHSPKAHFRVSPFNDLDVVKASPTAFNIEKIKSIIVYHEDESDRERKEDWGCVVGIETTYQLLGGDSSPPVLHGRRTQTKAGDGHEHGTVIEVGDDERTIAAFVGYDQGEKKIRALCFTKTNVKDGSTKTEGYIDTSKSDLELTYKAAFGEIVAFQGIKMRGSQSKVMSIGFQTRQFVMGSS